MKKTVLFWLMVLEVQGQRAASGDGVLAGSPKTVKGITWQETEDVGTQAYSLSPLSYKAIRIQSYSVDFI